MLRKSSISLLCALPLALTSCGESINTAAAQTVEIGCGSCSYSMEGVEGCVPAVKLDGKPMLVTGEHGLDAHAEGLCSGTKQAELTGAVEGDSFVATNIKLVN